MTFDPDDPFKGRVHDLDVKGPQFGQPHTIGSHWQFVCAKEYTNVVMDIRSMSGTEPHGLPGVAFNPYEVQKIITALMDVLVEIRQNQQDETP